MLMVAWKGDMGLSPTVLKRMTTASSSKTAMLTGHFNWRVKLIAQAWPAWTTSGSPWKPQLSEVTSEVI